MKTIDPAIHYWSQYANTTRSWLGSDSQEHFDNNMCDAQRRAQIQKHGYDHPNAITYVFNSHGFRCSEFDHRDNFIALGCSHTAGVGVAEYQSWPSLVSQRLGLACYNLAVGAGSMDTCMRLLYHYVDLLEPRMVMLLRPGWHRVEIFNHNRVLNLLPARLEFPEFQKIWYSNDINLRMNCVKNTLAIEHLCKSRNIPLVIKDAETDLLLDQYRSNSFTEARDLMHAGPQEHLQCAESFLESLNQN